MTANFDSHNFYNTMAISLQKKLKDEGWYITDEGLKKLSDDGKISDSQGLIRKALDMDLKEISSGGLPPDFAKSSRLDVPSGGYIVQIQRIQNISAPKCNQESKAAPRMLLLELTDGATFCSAIELDHLSTLSVNTPPGTKILLKGTIKIFQGMLALTPSTFKSCNGVVTAMVEKWEHDKAMSKYAKGVKPNSGGAPPPWTPFGQKNEQTLVNEFKSLSVEKKNEETKEKDIEFIANRNEAIAEILKTKQKKIFGGGNRQLLDHNVKKIMEKGYTEEQAKTSLKFARNNLEKAMGNLKRREERSSSETTSSRGPFNKGQKEDRFGRKGRMEETEGAKPSNKVSLFDFLEDKIKIPKATETTSTYGQSTTTTANTTNKSGAKSSDEPYPKKNYRSDEYPPSNRPSHRNTQSINGSTQSQSHSADNRSKFENNMSASFASRQKKDDDQYPNSRNYNNDSRANKWSGKPTNMAVNQRQNSQEPSSGSYNKAGTAPRSQNSNYSQKSYQNNGPPTGTAYGQKYSKSNFNETGKPSRFDEKHQHPRNEQTDRRSNAPYNVNQLTEATASMKLSNNGKRHSYNNQSNYSGGKHQQSQQQSQPSSTRQQQQSSQNHPGKNPPMANGFEYNAYKIMGFQNKETNEYALNVLKNQNFDAVPATVLGKQQQQQQPALQATQPMPSDAFVPIPANRNFVVPPPPTAVMAPQQFIPAVAMTSQPFNWTWKEHDICFAKYWEDQRYYQAEITAVTNKTCVVQFLEYGNYEEVLLSDCLPINDANIQSINQYNNSLIIDQSVQYYQQQQQQHRLHNERPIYVTPAQRSGK